MADKRKQLRVKSKFQDRVILDVILVTFVLVNLLILFSVFAVETVQDLGKLKMILGAGLAIGEFGGLAAVYYLSLKASHRIAGPVFALERRLDGIAGGDLAARLQFRQDDHFKETADKLNHSVDMLRSKISSIRHRAENLQDELGESEMLDGLIAELDFFNLHQEPSSGTEQAHDRASVPAFAGTDLGSQTEQLEQVPPAPLSPKA